MSNDWYEYARRTQPVKHLTKHIKMECTCGYQAGDTSLSEHIVDAWHFPSCSCGKAYASLERLLIHHLDTGHDGCAIASGYDFICSCGLLCTDMAHLLRHQKNNSRHSAYRSRDDLAALLENGLNYACDICYCRFGSPAFVEEHILKEHPDACSCPQCGQRFRGYDALRNHRRIQEHCYCATCDQHFDTVADFDSHNEAGLHVTEFMCLECGESFTSVQGLEHHLQDRSSHVKPQPEAPKVTAVVTHGESKWCKQCKRWFNDGHAYEQHVTSLKHKPIAQLTCPISSSCKRRFQSPSALVQHLESGSCSSGMDRHKLNALVRRVDSGQMITNGRASDSNALGSTEVNSRLDGASDSDYAVSRPIPATKHLAAGLTPQLARSLADVPMSVAFGKQYQATMASSLSDIDEDDGGVTLPPSTAISRTALWTSSNSTPIPPALATITTRRTKHNSFSCPMCPPSRKPFDSLSSLQRHMSSTAHAPKVYHCPTDLMAVLGAKRGGHAARQFATLGALTQHIEAGACTAGPGVMQKALSFVEMQMKAFGALGWASVAGQVRKGIAGSGTEMGVNGN